MEPELDVDVNFLDGVAEADAMIEESQPLKNTTNFSMYNAETLKSIFEKHGNIANDCTLQSPTLRTSFLEAICNGVQELQSKKLSEIDHGLLNFYYLVVSDCETMKFNVKWFAQRLDEIRAAIDSLFEYQNIAEKMKQLEEKKRNLLLKRIELEAAEDQLESETLVVVEDMNRSSRDLECRFNHFEDMHLMHGVL